MSKQSFENVKLIFRLCEKKVRNDQKLGEWLIQRGAELVALGIKIEKQL